MKKDIITMSKKEFHRLPVIHKVIDKRLTQAEAAKVIGLCVRQVKRIVRKVKMGGDQAIIHGNRGRQPPNKLLDEKKNRIISIVGKHYSDFGPLMASEKLLELHNIKISKEKLRQLMTSSDIWHPKSSKRGKTHQWRERKHYRGEMLQMDGSHHDWLEDRGPKLVLMNYIDDATGQIYGRFYEFEGTFPAMDSFRRYISKYGLPVSIYLDKHGAYKTTRKPNLEEELKGEYAKTQVARAFSELDVTVIFAHSPQAKGRIERSFATLQDRLVKELRLANVRTLNEANAFLEKYLPEFNSRFARKPFKKRNLHRPISKNINLDEIFCIKETRTIGEDYSFHWKNRVFLIKEPSITLKRQRICVMETFNGKITAKFKSKRLSFTEITQKDMVAMAKVKKATQRFIRKARIYAPVPKNHPWKRFVISKRSLTYAY